MKTSFKVLLVLVLCTCFALSCSRKKDSFVNRNYHAVTTEFNILYNGYNALEVGRATLIDAYYDNFWEVLPVERMQISEDILLPGQSRNENFTYAEEKAAKAIQKHSMNIDNKEKNPQIDEAYLLLGKARYFDQRFIPAVEAFNYILYKYPASDKINQAKVWREKTNIRLDNNELAISNLKRLLRLTTIQGQDLADATSILAQAYINTDSISKAITQLGIASNATKSNDERGRYRLIQGQLYNKLGQSDSANAAFEKVIKLKRKTPRIYFIVAHLYVIANFDHENGDRIATLELLDELEENRENRPYLDKIYNQIATYHLRNESDSLAIRYYNKSLATNTRDNYLKARNYEALGNINFDHSVYAKAGLYYDSTMTNMTPNSKPYRLMNRKRDNLEDVILYEGIANQNDSILALVNMSDVERQEYFGNYIESLKSEANQAKQDADAAERSSGMIISNNQFGGQVRSGTPSGAALFYFYNPTTVAYGKNEFVKNWGDRDLQDDWRWSSQGVSNTQIDVAVLDVENSDLNNTEFDPEFYISKIPTDKSEIDDISKERNFAYYQLGLIYKEKFKEYELAQDKFQDLLESDPEERLILPSKYNLYKIYELLGEYGEAEIAKEDIILNYPDSRYANILEHPELVVSTDENSSNNLYKALYIQYENQEYESVILKCDDYINRFDGETIVSKFELLKATASGRLYGFEAYSKGMNHVAATYANTAEGKEAQHVSSKILPKLATKTFVTANDSVSENYKVIFQFKDAKPEAIVEFKATLDEILKKIRRYYDLKSSIDVYSSDVTFLVVHGLKSQQVAETFDQLMFEEDREKIEIPYFVISSTNYQIIQIHKNLEAYLDFYNN